MQWSVGKEQRLMIMVSPLIALYGIIPVYLFSTIPFDNILVSYLLLTGMIMLFWWGNLRLFRTSMHIVAKYLISYGVSLALHLAILILTPLLAGAEQSASFIIYPLVSTLAINSIILIIIHMQFLKRDKDTAETELGKVKMENLEAQKKMLTQQLQPHFLFNALSTLKSLISINETKAIQYTLSLSEFLRYTSQAGTSAVVTVQDEIRFTKDYIDLQSTRFEESLQISIEIDEHLMKCTLPAFAIQSLIENAIKHNAISARKPLTIRIYSTDASIVVSNPKQPKPVQAVSGTGLVNLRNRYMLLFNKDIDVQDEQDYFTVKIPVICP
jgi:two-component system, LytTR family, sensor kinase